MYYLSHCSGFKHANNTMMRKQISSLLSSLLICKRFKDISPQKKYPLNFFFPTVVCKIAEKIRIDALQN